MPRSDNLVHEIYAKHPELWSLPWKSEVIRQLARKVKNDLVSISPIQIRSQLGALADPIVRDLLVERQSSVIVDTLVAAQSRFRQLLKDACDRAGVGTVSVTKLRSILSPLVEQSVNTHKGSAIVATVSEHEVYSEIAGLLSGELHASAVSGTPPDEPLALNCALLVYHFRRWRIPFARLGSSITEMEKGNLGLRGNLISIQNRHRSVNNTDDFVPPIEPFTPVTFNTTIKSLTDILEVVENESKVIPVGAGLFHRAMPISKPVEPTLLSGSLIGTQKLAEEGRRLNYPQFEHTALLFTSLAGIEFLLRSFCPVSHSPDEVMTKVIGAYPDLRDELRERLVSIYSTEGWNIRNRCMHGSFLEIEGRREDLIRSSGILEIHGVPRVDLSDDGSLPANVSGLVLRALGELAQYVESVTTPISTTWTQHFLLSPTEFAEAGQIYCDILQSVEASEAWRVHIRDYLREVTPGISTAVNWGIMTWVVSGPINDAIPGFYFLALLFEPLLRLTLHLAGKPILQRSMSADTTGSLYRIQYLMLDSIGLLSPPNITWLTQHLDSTEKRTAERVLELAMKCRDAVAHGAISRFTEETRTTYGHMIVKAIQLVVEAGRRHLTSTPAVRNAHTN